MESEFYWVAEENNLFFLKEIELDHTSYVAFRINERFQRICLWINQVGDFLDCILVNFGQGVG